MKSNTIIALTISAIIGFVALFFVIPVYNVWQQTYAGKAALAKAEQTRQILTTQARAEKEAALYRAQAIAIVGEAAQRYPEYRTQEYIGAFAEALKEGKINQIIYVPTEASIPILESGKREKAE